MSASDDAKEIIRRWNNEGWSGGKYELAHEIISPDMQVHGAGGQAVGMGPDGLIDLIKTWRTAFPDGRMEIDDLIVEGDTVAIRNTWYGTQSEEFYGIPPSGKSVAVTSVDWLMSTFGILATYGSPAYTQVADLALLQPVSVTGIWGLTFLIHWLAPVANEVWEHASEWRGLVKTCGKLVLPPAQDSRVRARHLLPDRRRGDRRW